MLDKQIADKILAEAIGLGASFADIFVERNRTQNISFVDSKVNGIASGDDFGIGVRVVYGTKALYGYTNLDTEDELLRITRLLCQLDGSITALDSAFNFSVPQEHNIHPIEYPLSKDVSLAEKVTLLNSLDTKVREYSFISQANLNIMQRMQDVEIFNSEGLWVKDQRNYARLAANVVAGTGMEQATGWYGPGAMAGWEFLSALDLDMIAARVAKQADTILHAQAAPAGNFPVVIDNGFGGVIFHEACGHALETTAVQKKASVFYDKMGQTIAAECVNAIDDGTMQNEWGSLNFDDEGTPTQRTELIKNGVLNSFLVDRIGELRTGYKRTGSGRKQSYKFAPASRMRNTFIEPGKSSLEEMISSVSLGIYAKDMGGGSVNPGTGEFNFSVREGYMIRNGKIAEAIKGATLIGTGADILRKISMVGNNFQQATGMCGSVSGSIPTNVGQPALKVDDILVGGRA